MQSHKQFAPRKSVHLSAVWSTSASRPRAHQKEQQLTSLQAASSAGCPLFIRQLLSNTWAAEMNIVVNSSSSRPPSPPPLLPRSVSSRDLLPNQAETSTLLLRPLAVVQQQQLKPPPRTWIALLQQLASKKAAAVFYALLALLLVWYVAAAGRSSKPAADPTVVAAAASSSSSSTAQQAQQGVPDAESPDSSSKGLPADSAPSSSQLPARCPYGSLPGTWVSTAPTGAKWQLLDPDCQLKNWLAVYAGAAAAAAAAGGSAAAEVVPAVNLLLLSDSVDRYIVQHVCDYLHGVKHTIHARQEHMHPAVPEPPHPPTASAAAVEAAPSSSNSSSGGSPSNLNVTAYAFHTCSLGEGLPLKLASSYFPGVHPTGPFHRGLMQNYAARIDAAVSMWGEYAGAGQPPHAVSVASALWDVARLWLHERPLLEGPELGRPLLDGWVANFSAVVGYSRTQLPQTQVWLTHTTMLPAHNITTGAMAKPYLGRRYFIEQLNAAAAAAARQLELQLVDYAAVSSRFREGQQHLADLIHPNEEVALEVFNVLLNLALEPRSL